MTGITTKRTSILEHQKKKFGENLKLSWFFDTVFEKTILILLGTLGLWKIFDLIKQWLM
jgi:hypothetical protein